MLEIKIDGAERRTVWDTKNEEFVTLESIKSTTLMLEHSLLSISKWEAKYHKPFLGGIKREDKTPEEMLYYIQCMTINNVDPNVYYHLTEDNIREIGNYISDPMTATTINHNVVQGAPPRRNTKIVTSELIYYWMVAHQIPFECQKWHLNRLMTLIEVCNIENAPSKKMSKRDIMRQNSAINAARRAKYHSHG